MSWLWSPDETAEQAANVVTALQSELDERQEKINALESALRREQQTLTQIIQQEVYELEKRKEKLLKDLKIIDELLQDKKLLLDTPAASLQVSKKKVPGTVLGTRSQSSPALQKKDNKASISKVNAIETSADSKNTIASEKKEDGETLNVDTENEVKEVIPVPSYPVEASVAKIQEVEPNLIFIIERSTNANTVVYAGNMLGNGNLDPSKPVEVYWIMYEKKGTPREGLNMLERNTAYGVSASPHPDGHYQVSLASLKDRPCILVVDESPDAEIRLQARTTINGKQDMILRRVYVQMTTSWGVPTVEYVEIIGVDPTTKERVYEKKFP